MFTITSGTEKQVKYANDIIRKPIINVEHNIAELEHDNELHMDAYGKEIPNVKIIPVLRRAIAIYEKKIDESAESLTAKVVIESYRDYNMFQRLMWGCLSQAFTEEGFAGSSPVLSGN